MLEESGLHFHTASGGIFALPLVPTGELPVARLSGHPSVPPSSVDTQPSSPQGPSGGHPARSPTPEDETFLLGPMPLAEVSVDSEASPDRFPSPFPLPAEMRDMSSSPLPFVCARHWCGCLPLEGHSVE